jgi:hypothetical protein
LIASSRTISSLSFSILPFNRTTFASGTPVPRCDLGRLSPYLLVRRDGAAAGGAGDGAVLHVRRVKNGTPSTHPIQGDELRALRRLHGRARHPRPDLLIV